MSRRSLTAAFVVFSLAAPCPARDPGPIETRPRSAPGSSEGFVPEQVDVSRLHGPAPRPREGPRLYEQVEDDIDREKGRVEDEQTYEVRRIREDGDRRLGRLEARREFERLQEEIDRRTRMERRAKTGRPAPAPQGEKGIGVDVPAAAVESTLTRFLREQEQLLEAARERYQADLRAAEMERDEAIRAAGNSAQARTLANRRFQTRRSELTGAYRAYRSEILGRD